MGIKQSRPPYWRQSKLKPLIEHQKGYAFKNSQYVEKGNIIVKVSNFTDDSIDISNCVCLPEIEVKNYDQFVLKGLDVLVATVGSWPTAPSSAVGRVVRVPIKAEGALLNQNTVRLRAKEGLEQRFLYYILKNNDFQDYVGMGARGSANQASITLEHIFNYRFPLPTLKEQSRIADILGTLDDKIDLNRRMNRTLEAMARALFKSWFVDFDPVRAKQRGEAPVGVDAETAALFPERLVDSELGEIPEGWGHGKIGDVSKVYGGSTPKTKIPKYWDDPKHYWATPKDLSGQEMPILLDTIRKLSDAGLDNVTNGQRPAGTLLMSKRAPIGYLALARVPTAINQGFVALEPKGHVSNYFMLNWLHFNMELVKSRANGSTFKEISQTAFRNLPMVIPPRAVVERFDELVDAFYVKIEANLRESQTLGEMRDVLLPELLGGRLSLGKKTK